MKKFLGLIIALVYFVFQALLVPQVSLSWDEPASFFIGRANLKFWLTGNRQYLDDLKNRELFRDSPFWYTYGEEVYPPAPFVVASVFSYILAEKMQLMHFITAHHLGELVIGAFGVWAMYGLATLIDLSPPLAAATTLIYALYPTIVGQMRSDAKDVPLVSMLVIFMYFFIRLLNACQRMNPGSTLKLALISGLTFGLACATKPTAPILLPIILAWFTLSFLLNKSWRQSLRPFNRLFLITLLMGIVAGFSFFLGWPWLWQDTLFRLQEVWKFFKVVGYYMPVPFLGTIYRAGVNVPWYYPYGILLFQTPLELTLLAFLGMLVAWRRFFKGKVYPLLFFIWFWVGIGRFHLPGMIIYHKVRHFIDVIPAFILLAGLGLEAIYLAARKIRAKSRKQVGSFILISLILISVMHEIWIIRVLFPYEASYFNFLVGGIRNVAQKRLFDVDTGSTIKEAMAYFSRVSPQVPIKIYPCLMQHLALYYKTPEMQLITQNPELADYTLVPNSPSWFGGALEFLPKYQQLVYTVKRDGADLFYIYKHISPVGWRCGQETETTYAEN